MSRMFFALLFCLVACEDDPQGPSSQVGANTDVIEAIEETEARKEIIGKDTWYSLFTCEKDNKVYVEYEDELGELCEYFDGLIPLVVYEACNYVFEDLKYDGEEARSVCESHGGRLPTYDEYMKHERGLVSCPFQKMPVQTDDWGIKLYENPSAVIDDPYLTEDPYVDLVCVSHLFAIM